MTAWIELAEMLVLTPSVEGVVPPMARVGDAFSMVSWKVWVPVPSTLVAVRQSVQGDALTPPVGVPESMPCVVSNETPGGSPLGLHAPKAVL